MHKHVKGHQTISCYHCQIRHWLSVAATYLCYCVSEIVSLVVLSNRVSSRPNILTSLGHPPKCHNTDKWRLYTPSTVTHPSPLHTLHCYTPFRISCLYRSCMGTDLFFHETLSMKDGIDHILSSLKVHVSG